MRKLVSNFVLAILAVTVFASRLAAHPMGNLSFNHYSRIHASPTAVSVHTVLDYAEIPTLQLFSDWGLPSDSRLNPAELQPAIERLVAQLSKSLRLFIDGKAAALEVSDIRQDVAAGAGGLPTFRLSFDLTTHWKAARARIKFVDDTYRERIGWKEIVVSADASLGFPEGNAFWTDRSAALTRYPSDLLSSPPNTSSASVQIAPGMGAKAMADSSSPPAAPATEKSPFLSGNLVRGDRLSEILSQRELSWHVVLVALGIAFILELRFRSRFLAGSTSARSPVSYDSLYPIELGFLSAGAAALAEQILESMGAGSPVRYDSLYPTQLGFSLQEEQLHFRRRSWQVSVPR